MSQSEIDWSECPLVEVNEGVQGGAAVLVGTRMPVDAIVDNSSYGLTSGEIAEQFELILADVESVLTYAQSHRIAHRV